MAARKLKSARCTDFLANSWLAPAAQAEVKQATAFTRQVQAGNHIKTGQNLARHGVVLAGVQPLNMRPLRGAQRVVHGGQFDDFRARA